MKQLLSAVVSLAIIAGAYFWSFGVPNALSHKSSGEGPAAQASERPRPGARGPGRPGGRGPTTVVLTSLVMQPFEDTFRAIGSSEAVRRATVTSEVSGRVVEVNLSSNAQVSQGDILVQLDARAERLSLETARNTLQQASDTVARYERLQASGNSTVSDVTISDAKLAQRLAEANVELAQLAIEDLTIRAPISGRLGLSDLNVGDFASANDAIVTIDNSSALLVEFELPERSVSFLSLGREVTLGTPSLTGRFFKGEIVSFDSRIDGITRSVTVKARVENVDGTLWPGMTFTVQLANLSEPLLVVPTTAITWSRDGASIWFENEGVAMNAPATVLFRRDQRAWLDVDLPVGTMVVTEGAHKLRRGAAIADANAEPQDPKREPT